MAIADDIQAVSIDEALIEVTTSVEGVQARFKEAYPDAGVTETARHDFAQEFAESLRAKIKETTGCESELAASYILYSLTVDSHNFSSKHRHISQHHARSPRYQACQTCRIIPHYP